jgi:hypothetical protein
MTDNNPFLALANLYEQMEEAYQRVATLLDFSCTGCPDNCCDSYFQHHTYIEWAYLRQGFTALPPERQALYRERARAALIQYQEALARDERPLVMCPVNDEGRCGLYQHRLLICRLHGVPASLTSPNGQQRQFPGCFRCQEITANQANLTTMDRTLFFKTMVSLEQAFLGNRCLPRVRMTLAEMLVREF